MNNNEWFDQCNTKHANGDYLGATRIAYNEFKNGNIFALKKCAFELSNGIGNILKQKKISEANDLLDAYMHIFTNNPIVPESHIWILIHILNADNAILKIPFRSFFHWWNPDNFSEDNWKRQQVTGNTHLKEFFSIAEKAILRCAKDIMSSNDADTSKYISWIIEWLDRAYAKHPENEYILYHKAQLLNKGCHKSEAIKIAKDFIKLKSDAFWAWAFLGEIYQSNNKDLALACFCKAILCESPEEFKYKNHLSLAAYFESIGQYPEAKCEIEIVKRIFDKQNWSTRKIQNWLNKTWYTETKAVKNNKCFYNEQALKVDTLLTEELPYYSANIGSPLFKEPHKRKFYIRKEADSIIFASYEVPYPFDLPIGAPCLVKGIEDKFGYFRIYEVKKREGSVWDLAQKKAGIVDNINIEKQSFHILFEDYSDSWKTVANRKELPERYSNMIFYTLPNASNKKEILFWENNEQPSMLLSRFSGNVQIVEDKDFGFVEDIYISKDFIESYSLKNEDFISGLAIASFNKKKNTFGKKVIKIYKKTIYII